MTDFVMGHLVPTGKGANYRGHQFDEWLRLSTFKGPVLEIFDDFDLISTEIQAGIAYSVVLLPTLFETIKILNSDSNLVDLEWHGQVVETSWQAKEKDFDKAKGFLFESVEGNQSSWLLVETDFGLIIMSKKEVQKEIGSEIVIGSLLKWSNPRWDLLAIKQAT